MNSIPYTKEDRRANAAHLQRQFVLTMFDQGELLNACHAAIKTASDEVWYSIQNCNGMPAYPQAERCEIIYYMGGERKERMLDHVMYEAGYRIWRSMRLFNGDPTQNAEPPAPWAF